MSNETVHRKSEVLANTTVIDCDVHTAAGKELLEPKRKHLPEPYASYLNEDVMDGDPSYPGDGWPRTRGGRQSMEMAPAGDAEDINEHLCEEFHVDYPIVNSLAGLELLQDRERAVHEMRAVNNMLIEQFLDGPDNIYGLGYVTLSNPTESAEEIDRLADEDGMIGIIVMNPMGTMATVGDPKYELVYEAATENDLTVAYHSGAGMTSAVELPIVNWKLRKWVSNHAISHPMSQMLTVASLVTNGIPVQYPDLNFMILEAGIGWVPSLMSRLNRFYAERPDEAPLLEKPPEEYVRENFYFGTQPLCEPSNPDHLHSLLDVVGADSIVFSTDFPHFDFDNPESVDNYLRSLFTPEEREKVLYRNAAEAFDLEV